MLEVRENIATETKIQMYNIEECLSFILISLNRAKAKNKKAIGVKPILIISLIHKINEENMGIKVGP